METGDAVNEIMGVVDEMENVDPSEADEGQLLEWARRLRESVGEDVDVIGADGLPIKVGNRVADVRDGSSGIVEYAYPPSSGQPTVKYAGFWHHASDTVSDPEQAI